MIGKAARIFRFEFSDEFPGREGHVQPLSAADVALLRLLGSL